MNYLRLRLTRFGGRGGTSTGTRARRRLNAAPSGASTTAANAAPTGTVSAAIPVNPVPVSAAATAAPTATTPVPPAAPTAPATNTTVTSDAVTNFSKLSDSAMATAINKAVGVGMPNQINDKPDPTQQLVFAAGFNEKPMVLDTKAFNTFMKNNGLTTSDLLSRDVNPVTYKNASNTQIKMTAQDVVDMMMYSRVNYIGGKIGGQAYGAGTYFDHTNGRSTGYGRSGSVTAVAVLNPKTTKSISYNTLKNKIPTWRNAHPKSAAAIDNLVKKTSGRSKESLYALAMGYNVITDGTKSGYVNVIDRSALVYRV